MSNLYETRVDQLLRSGQSDTLCGGLKGLEKESLRISSDGEIAQTPHPVAWGAPLTHPYITTDYSEALPELITPAFAELDQTYGFLHDLHTFLYQNMGADELLWAASMPCAVADDSRIPIAEYGSSNVGQMKHIYRVGLDYRYGRRMQAIAGVHFNYSLPPSFWPVYESFADKKCSGQTFIDESYFDLIRNFKRLGWIVPFLFGNSPAVCKTFLAGRTTRFKAMSRGTYYLPYATSLRMSDIGYKNKNQSALTVSYDALEDYVRSLNQALVTPYPEYEAIGLTDGDKRVQLSTNVLQIENEYYSFIRPKRTTEKMERPTTALHQRGVEYVEVRALDVNCLSPTGVDIEQLRFIEAFLIYCLLSESPRLTSEALSEIEYNELTVALRGRTPGLDLIDSGQRRCIWRWATSICEALKPIGHILDDGDDDGPYSEAIIRQIEQIAAPDKLPAAYILKTLQDQNVEYHNYVMSLSNRYAEDFRSGVQDASASEKFRHLAEQSLGEQRELEANDDESLSDYIARYLAS